MSGDSIKTEFEILLAHVLVVCQQYYGSRLVSLAVFGSVGRSTPHPNSDLDLLIVAENLPERRLARVAEFHPVEAALSQQLAKVRAAGLTPELSPLFKTPAEARRGSLLFLDMIEDTQILYDRENFLGQTLTEFKARLAQLGARRIWRGNAWHWDLKPDYKPGEVFEL